jgi:hypothetical protein
VRDKSESGRITQITVKTDFTVSVSVLCIIRQKKNKLLVSDNMAKKNSVGR